MQVDEMQRQLGKHGTRSTKRISDRSANSHMHARVRFARVSNRPAAARTEPAGEDENATASKA